MKQRASTGVGVSVKQAKFPKMTKIICGSMVIWGMGSPDVLRNTLVWVLG